MAEIRKTTGAPGNFDVFLLFFVLFLTGIGIVMIYSASSTLATERFNNSYFFLKRQAMFTCLGGCILFICSAIDYRKYRPFVYLFLAGSIGLLIATHISGYGHSAGGAQRWIRFAGFSIQPSEVTRISLIMYLAYSLSKKQERLNEFKIGFLPHVIIFGILGSLIITQPDFGSVVILGTLTWIMMFVGGVKVKHLILPLIPMLPAAGWIMVSESYRVKRLTAFLDPWAHQLNESYQLVHSLMAFGSGGLIGKGLGNGYQKLFYLPEPHTDFIFAVIGEELGLWGNLGIISVYFFIIWRGIIIARRTTDPFGSLLATGLTAAIGLQVCVNMGVALGLLPTKGLTLPFLSYGGSSLLMNMIAVGILINIGRVGNNE